ncbi:MAG: hypothetical protein ACHQPH_07340 [Reyranellales bacterium]
MAIKAWRIDAMDALGGLAFASYRAADLLDRPEEPADLDIPCFALSAPDFRPEPLVSRALAFAGTRRGHQFGVWADGQEIEFDELESVVEFVRRVYLMAAGRGGGGETPPPAGEVGGDRPFAPGGGPGEMVVTEIKKTAELFGSSYSLKHPGAIELVPWPIVNASRKRRGALFDLCGRAAMSVLTETSSRVVGPDHNAYPWWCRAFSAAFGIAVTFADYEVLGKDDWYYNAKLQVARPGLNFRHLLHDAIWWRADRLLRGDPLLALELVPVDPKVAGKLGHRSPNRASLFDVVRILVANPRLLAEDETGMRTALLLLGAAILCRTAQPGLPFDFAFETADALDGEAIWAWLVAQLPRGRFDGRVEGLISQVGLATVERGVTA